MTSFLDRVRKLFRRKPKQQRPEKMPDRSEGDGAQHSNSPPAQHGQQVQHHQDQQAPLGAVDGAADTSEARAQAVTPATRSGTLQISLVNQTSSSTVYAYISGSAIDRGGALFLLSADGRTPYYPPNPSSTGTKIAQDTSIRLGPPGSAVNALIPRLAGGRIWFSIGAPLVFAINPGPGLIEPSVSLMCLYLE